MAFWSLLKSLFSGRASLPPERVAVSRPVAQSTVPARPEAVHTVIVHTDELIDGRPSIAGYVFRAKPAGRMPALDARALHDALDRERVAHLAQRRLAIIPLSVEHWQAADFRSLIAAHTLFLVAPPAGVEDAPSWLLQVESIKQAGARVGFEADTLKRVPSAWAMADLVSVDFRQGAFNALEAWLKAVHKTHPRVEVLVSGVGTWPEHRLCQVLGARYSTGDFPTKPDEDMKHDALSQSRTILVEMLNLLRSDAEVSELAALAKRDPGIVAKVVDMANSPVSGLAKPIASLDQAFLVLGRERLYRWISKGIFRAGGGDRDEMLLEIALRRARFLELVAKGGLPKVQCDELFLVGMFSIFDTLLGLPLNLVVEKVHVPQPVADVLLRNEGPYGHYLSLALIMEMGRSDQVAGMAEKLGIPLDAVRDANGAALAWAEEALRAS